MDEPPLSQEDPLAVALTQAIKEGATEDLDALLAKHPRLATTRIHDEAGPAWRSALHLATDWPGHFPNVARTIELLVAAGADVNAPMRGPNEETPLHWAASSNDVKAIDALLDAGADLDARGAVIAGGDPLEDAIGFQNWEAARHLVERGARTNLGDEAALGLMANMKTRFAADSPPGKGGVDYAFWNACCAGQLEAAQFLHEQGADLNWIPDWCEEGPLEGAVKSKNEELVSWLKSRGAQSSVSLDGAPTGESQTE